MKLLTIGALLLFAAAAAGQQQAHPPYNPSPYSTPPTFPQEKRPTEPMPPDTKAPPPKTQDSADVQQQIQSKLFAEPLLANADVNARADRESVVLTGTVENEEQRALALRIAETYAGDRKVIDRLQIRQRT